MKRRISQSPDDLSRQTFPQSKHMLSSLPVSPPLRKYRSILRSLSRQSMFHIYTGIAVFRGASRGLPAYRFPHAPLAPASPTISVRTPKTRASCASCPARTTLFFIYEKLFFTVSKPAELPDGSAVEAHAVLFTRFAAAPEIQEYLAHVVQPIHVSYLHRDNCVPQRITRSAGITVSACAPRSCPSYRCSKIIVY